MNKSEVLKWLKKKGTRRTVGEMARYGIEAKRAFGVPMGTLLALRKQLGKDQALSLALWDSGWYEARLLAALVGEPQRVTRRQMNAWPPVLRTGVTAIRSAFILRPHAFRLGKSASMACIAATLRQTRRLRADGVPCASRQSRP